MTARIGSILAATYGSPNGQRAVVWVGSFAVALALVGLAPLFT